MPKHCIVYSLLLLLASTVTPCAAVDSKPRLSASEREWIRAHPLIRLAPDPNYPPVEFFDQQGRYRGIAADYVNLLQQKLDIQIEIVQLDDWDAVLRQVQSRDIDLLGAAAPSPQRREYLAFTELMVQFPGVIIVPADVTGTLALTDIKGLRVATVSGYIWQDRLERQYPDIRLDLVPDVETGLRKLSFGLVDAMVANLATASYHIERQGIGNLRVAGETPYMADLAIGVRNDWPELVGILNKGLAQISAAERTDILARWVHLKTGRSPIERTTWRLTIAGLALAILIVFLIIGWNRSLRKQVNQRTDELQQAQIELEKRVGERTTELQESNRLLMAEVQGRSEAETKLLRFKSTLDQTLDCVFMFNADDLRFIYVNQGAIDQVGYSGLELLNMTPVDIKPHHDSESFSTLLAPLLDGELHAITFETLHRHRDGHDIPVEIFLQHISSGVGKPLFVAIVRDITERKKVDRLKSEFISTVSHELRTPLTAIRGALGILNSGTLGGFSERAVEMLNVATRNSERLVLLVNDILDIEKLESEAVEFYCETADLNTLVVQSLRENQAYAQQLNVFYVLQSSTPDLMVNVDPGRIAQVLANLLSNAAKFSHEGGEIIVRVVKTEQTDRARVEVLDHGIGISEGFKARVFEKFSQDDHSDARSVYGTGLGLSISKSIVEQHHGILGFHSERDQGSCFYFELPLQHDSSNKSVPQSRRRQT